MVGCILSLLIALRVDGLGAGVGDHAGADDARWPWRRGHAGHGVRMEERVGGVADGVRRGPTSPAIVALASIPAAGLLPLALVPMVGPCRTYVRWTILGYAATRTAASCWTIVACPFPLVPNAATCANGLGVYMTPMLMSVVHGIVVPMRPGVYVCGRAQVAELCRR